MLLGLWFILWLTTDILDSYRWSVVSNLDARLLYISIVYAGGCTLTRMLRLQCGAAGTVGAGVVENPSIAKGSRRATDWVDALRAK